MKAILMAAFLLMVVPLLVFPADQRGTPGTGDPQIQREIATLREGLQKLKIETANEIGSLRQMTQTSFSGVSTHLAAVNLFFGIAATFVTLIAIGLGVYVTAMANRMGNSYRKEATEEEQSKTKADSSKMAKNQLVEIVQGYQGGRNQIHYCQTEGRTPKHNQLRDHLRKQRFVQRILCRSERALSLGLDDINREFRHTGVDGMTPAWHSLTLNSPIF